LFLSTMRLSPLSAHILLIALTSAVTCSLSRPLRFVSICSLLLLLEMSVPALCEGEVAMRLSPLSAHILLIALTSAVTCSLSRTLPFVSI
ncbi:hypothetical protein J6590_085048, partial [Homalodisca vitripennis]